MKTILDGIFGGKLPGIEKAMDLTWRRNQAITSNIANAETPGYRATDLHFGEELERAFGKGDESILKTDKKHLDIVSNSGAHLMPDFSGATKQDGNNVDIDVQMGQLAYNRGKYAQAATVLRKQFSMIAQAIRTVA